MKIKDQFLSALLALFVLAGVALILYLLLFGLMSKLNSMNSDLSKATVAASVGLLAATITLVLGKLLEQRIQIKQQVREKKIPVYEEQLRLIFKFVYAEKLGESMPEGQEFVKTYAGITEKLIIWGGPDVIKAWSSFRETSSTASQLDWAIKFENFILALRRDVGNNNSGMAGRELLRLFVNDYHPAS